MNVTFPYTIENGLGESIVFQGYINGPEGEKLIVKNFVKPGSGPLMHTHFLQDELLTVIKGTIAYEIPGKDIQYATEGESVLFERGTPHRFWNAGDDTLICEGWINPPNTFLFFLSAVFAAQRKSGSEKPEAFDAAYLLTRYRGEYEIQLPWFVKKVLIPMQYGIGVLLGKYKHFKYAPAPVRTRK